MLSWYVHTRYNRTCTQRRFTWCSELLRFTNLGKAQRFVSRYSDKLFWHVSSCSLSMRKLSNRPSTLHASRTLGFLAVSCMIFFQALSIPSKRLASCKKQQACSQYTTAAYECPTDPGRPAFCHSKLQVHQHLAKVTAIRPMLELNTSFTRDQSCLL